MCTRWLTVAVGERRQQQQLTLAGYVTSFKPHILIRSDSPRRMWGCWAVALGLKVWSPTAGVWTSPPCCLVVIFSWLFFPDSVPWVDFNNLGRNPAFRKVSRGQEALGSLVFCPMTSCGMGDCAASKSSHSYPWLWVLFPEFLVPFPYSFQCASWSHLA